MEALWVRRTLVATAAVALLSAPAALAGGSIKVFENPAAIQGLSVQPSTLTMAADGNDTITGLHWTGWGSSTAHGSGVNHVNTCTPNCAEGFSKEVRVSVTLSSPGTYKGSYVYRCYSVSPTPDPQLTHFCLP